MHQQELLRSIDALFAEFPVKDASKNGLQIDRDSQEVRKIAFAVDATTYVIDQAIKKKADMLIVHHGLFWGQSDPLTGLAYKRVSRLVKADISLYAMHLPLDLHPTLGNNAGLMQEFCDRFGLVASRREPFGTYNGFKIGFGLRFDREISFKDLKEDFLRPAKLRDDTYRFSDRDGISSIAFVSGAAGDLYQEAKDERYDLYVTGEAKHSSLIAAKEIGQDMLLAGHYETETFGVKLLARHVEREFGLETVFIDECY